MIQLKIKNIYLKNRNPNYNKHIILVKLIKIKNLLLKLLIEI